MQSLWIRLLGFLNYPGVEVRLCVSSPPSSPLTLPLLRTSCHHRRYNCSNAIILFLPSMEHDVQQRSGAVKRGLAVMSSFCSRRQRRCICSSAVVWFSCLQCRTICSNVATLGLTVLCFICPLNSPGVVAGSVFLH